MAQSWCPSCRQAFAEEGFCPFDGTRLTAPPPPGSSPPETLRAVSATGDDRDAALAALGQGSPKDEYERLIGQTLDGRYKIERKIGEGGMGVVYAARHVVIEKLLAVKVLKREVARDAATIKRFVQEAKAASRIGHPGIVDVTDFGATPEGMTYSVMEYVDGTTLSGAIRRAKEMTLERALPIVAQIARALAAAHDKGIVHRDLKPENVFLVNRDGRRDFVKIVDFGIAKVTPVDGAPGDGPRLTRAGSVFGTPEYMAPEQAAGRPDTDQRVDVYALGTILYELLTGRVPHKGDSMVRTLAMQMLDPIEPMSKARPDLRFTPELEAVVMRALAKKREQRYPNMADLLTDLERACPGIPLGVAPPRGDGGPVHLVPAPPGADFAAMSAQPTVTDDGVPVAPPEKTTLGRSRPATPPPGVTPRGLEAPRATSKKVANEPAFVTSQRPVTFDHVFEETAEAPPRRARWPLLVGAVALAAAGGVAAALVLRGDRAAGTGDDRDGAPRDAGVAEAPVDATVVVEVPVDATVVAELRVDAGADPDAGRVGAARRDAGAGGVYAPPDAGVPRDRMTPRGTVVVQVLTIPDGGTIYVGDSYRGPSGTTLEEAPGTRLKIRCTLPGHEAGFVDVNFDGSREVVTCRPQRPKRCVDGLHNPFDDCPEPEPPR